MKTMVISAIAFLVLLSCSDEEGREAKVSLRNYIAFVDSIYNINEKWKQKDDTDIVEVLVDANTIRIDTIINKATYKMTIAGPSSGYHDSIMEAYDEVFNPVELSLPEMTEEMKKEFEASRQKFEALLVE